LSGQPEPPYVQVAGKIREQIRQEMSSGDRLPAVREIAREFGVNADLQLSAYTWGLSQEAGHTLA
jgi:DNA-binding transcriptional regulator YhcF (GntR family)